MKKSKEQGRRGAPEALPHPEVQESLCLASSESLWEEPPGSKGHRGYEDRPELAGRDNGRWQGRSCPPQPPRGWRGVTLC